MDNDNLLNVLVVVAVVISVVAAGISYNTISDLSTKVLGFASSDIAYANITIETAASINWTTASVDFGSGRVDDGQTSAYVDTLGTVTNGNWSAVSQGLVLENIGNINVSIELQSGSADPSADAFIGGTNPGYGWNVTNDEANSCTSQNVTFGQWYDANTSMFVCGEFQFADGSDTMQLDINLTIPYNSNTGALSDTITAVATAA